MSNAKRISKKINTKNFNSLRKEFALKLWFLECENLILKNQVALISSQIPRKPYPEDSFNPPKKENSILIGEMGKEKFFNRDGFEKKVVINKIDATKFDFSPELKKEVIEFLSKPPTIKNSEGKIIIQ